MLKKSERLGRYAFSKCFNLGKRFHGVYTTIIHSPSEVFLCSVVVGKKVSKKAPNRNKLRRRVYGIIEKINSERNIIGSYIILVKPETIRLSKKNSYLTLEEEIGRVIKLRVE